MRENLGQFFGHGHTTRAKFTPAAEEEPRSPQRPQRLADWCESLESFGSSKFLNDISTGCAPPTATTIPLAVAAFPINVPSVNLVSSAAEEKGGITSDIGSTVQRGAAG